MVKTLFLLLALLPAALRAEVEIVPLHYRTVEQVLPLSRPLLEPGGALSGTQNQAIIRASLANIADLKRVFLDINPRRETPGPGGSVNVQRVSTSASGRLGEWFEIGAFSQTASTRSAGMVSSSDARRQENRRVWVKVEELK